MKTTWKSGKTGKTSTGVTLGLVGWRRIWNRQAKLILRLRSYSTRQFFVWLNIHVLRCFVHTEQPWLFNNLNARIVVKVLAGTIKIWPAWCQQNYRLLVQQSRCHMWTEQKYWALPCKGIVKSNFSASQEFVWCCVNKASVTQQKWPGLKA